ncbi:alpha/beta hydrolase [Cognatiyoonia sp. IB215446]|uniref:alpha/beta fold hydrolase n=1 Tax=Cognatiyoonia sp. IB215446 TaxID=3097355 RepID=UPI002A144D24|nr:alpha/beta hydrolase [Cognatiyoonia sp. IB215446]MDX8346952.1 alpha/beta hydrolase [Cognatiyoonia sp. IB215446]
MLSLDNHQSIVAVHGSASSSKQWLSLHAAAAPDYQVVAPTVPDADPKARLDVVMNAIANSATPVHLIAHSFGASIAMMAAKTAPERVASVTLYDPVVPVKVGAEMSAPPDLRDLALVMQLAGAEHGMALFIEFWAGAKAWSGGTDKFRAAVIAKYGSVLRDFEQVASGVWNPHQIKYNGPMTILHGQESPSVILETTGFLQRVYPHAWLIPVAGLNHMTPLVASQLTDELFLNAIEVSRIGQLDQVAA